MQDNPTSKIEATAKPGAGVTDHDQAKERPAPAFTPGPWECGGKPYIVPGTGEGSQFSGGDWHIFPPLGEVGPVALVGNEANARLIIASPDYFAAVEQMIHAEDCGGEDWWKGWEALKAAHRKAGGVSPHDPITQRQAEDEAGDRLGEERYGLS